MKCGAEKEQYTERQIKPEWRKVPGAPACEKLHCEPTGIPDQRANCACDLCVETEMFRGQFVQHIAH